MGQGGRLDLGVARDAGGGAGAAPEAGVRRGGDHGEGVRRGAGPARVQEARNQAGEAVKDVLEVDLGAALHSAEDAERNSLRKPNQRPGRHGCEISDHPCDQAPDARGDVGPRGRPQERAAQDHGHDTRARH